MNTNKTPEQLFAFQVGKTYEGYIKFNSAEKHEKVPVEVISRNGNYLKVSIHHDAPPTGSTEKILTITKEGVLEKISDSQNNFYCFSTLNLNTMKDETGAFETGGIYQLRDEEGINRHTLTVEHIHDSETPVMSVKLQDIEFTISKVMEMGERKKWYVRERYNRAGHEPSTKYLNNLVSRLHPSDLIGHIGEDHTQDLQPTFEQTQQEAADEANTKYYLFYSKKASRPMPEDSSEIFQWIKNSCRNLPRVKDHYTVAKHKPEDDPQHLLNTLAKYGGYQQADRELYDLMIEEEQKHDTKKLAKALRDIAQELDTGRVIHIGGGQYTSTYTNQEVICTLDELVEVYTQIHGLEE